MFIKEIFEILFSIFNTNNVIVIFSLKLISFYIVVEETIFGVIFTFYGFRTAKNIG
jgi:hypothetical protein